DEVALAEKPRQKVRPAEFVDGRRLLSGCPLRCDDAHAERLGFLRKLRPDRAEADDAERLARYFLGLDTPPFFSFLIFEGLGKFLRQREDAADGELRERAAVNAFGAGDLDRPALDLSREVSVGAAARHMQ